MSNSERALGVATQRRDVGQGVCPHCRQPWLHRSDADPAKYRVNVGAVEIRKAETADA